MNNRCPNAKIPSKADRAIPYVKEWVSVYLKNALLRLQPQMNGVELTLEDIYTLQQVGLSALVISFIDLILFDRCVLTRCFLLFIDQQRYL